MSTSANERLNRLLVGKQRPVVPGMGLSPAIRWRMPLTDQDLPTGSEVLGALSNSKDAGMELSGSSKAVLKGTAFSMPSNRERDNGEDRIKDFREHQEVEKQSVSQFCPFSLVAKLPYKYMKGANDRVSKHFFASNKFYERKWDLHFIYPPQSFNKRPLLLVPRAQVQTLVDEISTTFGMAVEVPPFPFTIDFHDDGTPAPTALGTSNSRDEFTNLTETIPLAKPEHGECPPLSPSEIRAAYEAFHDKIENVLLVAKGKGTTKQKAKTVAYGLAESRSQMKRAERYLGLRPPTVPHQTSPGVSQGDINSIAGKQQQSRGLLIRYLNVDEAAHYSFEREPVIVSIDFESYERNHKLITEIGLSTLDTFDLVDTPPAQQGEDWVSKIRSRHFRIKGREHLVNREFCEGNPSAFQFGQSEFVTLEASAQAVDSCFRWPFSVQFRNQGRSFPASDPISDTSTSTTNTDPAVSQKGFKTRNIILIGHDINADLSYLEILGSQIFNHPNNSTKSAILETLDTAQLHQTLTATSQSRSLSHICNSLGITAWFAHNAGNDARYTLECFIKILIQARLDEDEAHRTHPENSSSDANTPPGYFLEDEHEAQKMQEMDARFEIDRKEARTQRAAKVARKTAKKLEAEVTLEEQIRRWNEGGGEDSSWGSAASENPLIKAPKGGW